MGSASITPQPIEEVYMIVEILPAKTNRTGHRAKCICDFCKKEFTTTYFKATNVKHQLCSRECFIQWKIATSLGSNNIFYGKKHKKESITKFLKTIGDSRKGSGNSNWNGGKVKNDAGYILVYKPEHPFKHRGKYVREHRLVMEEFIGRYLKPEEQVHHINKIVDDNKIENLMLFKNNAEHQRYHKEQRKIMALNYV